MSERVAIIGVGWAGFHTKTQELSYKEMVYQAAMRAYDDAGVDARADIQSFVTVAEDFHEGTSIFDEYTPDQIGGALMPVHTIAGDGLHGLATAYMLIKTGQCDVVAVEGHCKASNILTLPEITLYAQDPVLNRPLNLNSEFIAGLEMNRYLYESGTSREQCAAVVVKNRRNALLNPLASYPADLSLEYVLEGPPVAWPLTKHEIAPTCDAAVVMVLASEEKARHFSENPIWILGMGWCNDSYSLENRQWGSLAYIQKAAHMAYRMAGFQNPQRMIDFAEVDDQYAYRELMTLEALGLVAEGSAGFLCAEGYTSLQGELPVNVSGGSLGMGHFLDATGLVRTLEAVLQLRAQAGLHQLEDVEVGLVQSWRGLPTTSGAVAILSNM